MTNLLGSDAQLKIKEDIYVVEIEHLAFLFRSSRLVHHKKRVNYLE